MKCHLLCVLFFLAPCALAGEARISAEALRADIAFLRDALARTHPDLNFSTSAPMVEQALDNIAQDLPPSMTQDEAWRRLALINPVLADAHLFVGYPAWRVDSRAHQKAGGTLFPFEVRIDAQGQPVIASALGGGAHALAGARIVAIDGVDSGTAVSAMLARTHGDTPAFRTHLLAQRWWLFHWKLYGAAARYQLTLARGKAQWQVAVPGSRSTPALLREEGDPARLFRLEILPGGAARLTAASFDGEHLARFLAFTRDAFRRIRQQELSALTIDISANGGGDDSLWLEGLMPYLATRPYRTGSTYIKKVIEPNPARGESAGQVISGAIETWRAPVAHEPLRFTGNVTVAIGPSTYSSAILFANVMRDFQFGGLTGAGGVARRSQSGGVRTYTLPHSNLALWVPRFILHPPAGEKRHALLEAP